MAGADPTHGGGGGPLAGIRVLEMANFISGPYASMLLGDLGADVIKVELPGSGDPFRKWGGHKGGARPQFLAYNRGKRSVTLNVQSPGGQEVYRRLAAIKARYDPDNAFHHNKNIPPG